MSDLMNCAFTNPQAVLSKALEEDDIELFEQALQQGADPLVTTNDNWNLFEKALQTYGRAEFVKVCLAGKCSPTHINKYFNKSAISYAADSKDPRILEVLLEYKEIDLDKKYEGLTPLNSLAKNLTEENAEDISLCISLLLRENASLNIPDQKQMTPILYVIKNKKVSAETKRQLIRMLLSHPEIDLDSFRNGEARRILQNDYPDLIPQATIVKTNFGSLLTRIQNGEEALFVQCYSSFHDTDEPMNIELLIEATKKGLNRAADIILKRVTNINLIHNSKSIIQIACIWGNWRVLEQLLQHDSLQMRSQEENLLITVIKNLGRISGDIWCDYDKCFDLLLKSEKVDVNECDASGSTPLHYAVKYHNKLAIKQLLKHNAYIGTKSKFNDIPIDNMDPDILEEHFDSCITTNQRKAGDENFEIIIDFSNLIPIDSYQNKSLRFTLRNEMVPITHIADSKEMRYLLKHPLITSFLFLKWHRLSVIFYINLLIYSLFCISFVTHTVLKFRESDNQAAIALFGLLSFIGIGYLIIRELLQIIISPLGYFKSPINYMEIILICLCIATIVEQSYDQQTKKVMAVFTILLLSVELCFLVGSLPVLSISTHMLMLREVLKSFIKSFLLYSIFVITFSLCFYILFGKETETSNDTSSENEDFNKFTNPLAAVIKTIVMLTGEFDAGSLEFDTMYSYFVFLLFVIFMSIVLFNLLNGLAVNDTQMIREQAEINGSICRAKLLTCYESILTGQNYRSNGIVNHQPFLTICRRLISLFPHYISGKQISILPNNRNKILVPAIQSMAMKDLYDSNTNFLQQHENIDLEKKYLDSPVKFLPCCFNFITGKCSEMDSRTVKMAAAVIERKNQVIADKARTEYEELRLKNIEDKIEEMFKMLKNRSSI